MIIPQSIGFYSALFAAEPPSSKPDYAKWMLDDPRVNFAISTRGREPGLDHLGIQVEERRTERGLRAACGKRAATSSSRARPTCCYAKSEKSWIDDPAGIAWETFLTTGESINYGDGTGENDGHASRMRSKVLAACREAAPAQAASACC